MTPAFSIDMPGGSIATAARRVDPDGQDRDRAARVPSHGFRPALEAGGRTGHPTPFTQNGRACSAARTRPSNWKAS